jgi:thiamine-phosphate pyrophosphorylase
MSQHQRLILFTPVCSSAEALAPALTAAVSSGRIDAVILRLDSGDDRSLINIVKALGPIVQEAGAALLLQDHMHLVVRAGADGVHLSTPDLLEDALGLLHPQDRIVGCAGLRARHDAMEAAEAGCDYVMFGEPFADGGHLPIASVIERGQWWAELFQTPCVVYVPDPQNVSAAAATGAEFVALGDALLMDAKQVPVLVSQALKDIADAPAPVSTGRI